MVALSFLVSSPEQTRADDRPLGPPASLQIATRACLLQARTNQQRLGNLAGLSGPALEREYNFRSRISKTLIAASPCELRTPVNSRPYWHCPDRSAKSITCLTFPNQGSIQTVLSDSSIQPARRLRDLEAESIQIIRPDSLAAIEEWSFGPLGYWVRGEIDSQDDFHILEWNSVWSDPDSEIR